MNYYGKDFWLLLYTADIDIALIPRLTLRQQIQKAVENDPDNCSQCLKDCNYKDTFKFCNTHKIQKQDAYSGQHFCLEHAQYHCLKHWKQCCVRFGYSVMTARPVTTAHLHKRAREIIEEQQAEIKKLEMHIEQIKQGRFICAECRQTACICNMSKWKRYDKKRRVDIKKSVNNDI